MSRLSRITDKFRLSALWFLSFVADDTAFDFPDLKIICAHPGGWQYMDTLSRMLRHRNVCADINFRLLNPLFKELVPWKLLKRTLSDTITFRATIPLGRPQRRQPRP